ncbi:molybdopterin-dependent oxidoreductase, partial [Escherichia coli]|nr:molybdopterin-dependent oxidoreductase [Escherichia coli]
PRGGETPKKKGGGEKGGGRGSGGGRGFFHEDAEKAKSFKQASGRGGFGRSSWQEVNELIAASNVYTIKNYGPDRVAGFSPIPAMSMVSTAPGTPYPARLPGTVLMFYDRAAPPPPRSPQPGGEHTSPRNTPPSQPPPHQRPGGDSF